MSLRFYETAIPFGCLALLVLLLRVQPPVLSASRISVDYRQPPIVALEGRTLRSYSVPETSHGVAADSRYFYAVDATAITKYEVSSGNVVDRWGGVQGGLIAHMSSCLADSGRLWCANSNDSEAPLASSIEVFNTLTLDHLESHSMGLRVEGSLTWFDRSSAPMARRFRGPGMDPERSSCSIARSRSCERSRFHQSARWT